MAPPGYAPPGWAPYPPPPYPSNDAGLSAIVPFNQSGWAIASGYLGLFSFLIPLLGPVAIITGVLALRAVRRTPGLGGTVRAVIGIILGAITTLLMGLIIGALIVEAAGK